MQLKSIVLLFFLILSPIFIFSQTEIETLELKKVSKKNRLYIYSGWNRGFFSKSDIHFKSDNYKFTLQDVIGKDRQTDFSIEGYFKPSNLTVPQTNFGVGYYLNDHYVLNINFDHMKYVVQNQQEVKINGFIKNTSPIYDGIYEEELIKIRPNFLQMEHTDGLNYINVGLTRADNLLGKLEGLKNKLGLEILAGVATGPLVPRSDISVLRQDDVNKYHLAGWGVSANTGLRLTVFRHYFIQGIVKGGYINLFDIITSTAEGKHRAKQDFYFLQTTFQFGGIFYIK